MSHALTEPALEEALSRPSDALVADLAQLEGDIVILGAGGKMGPTLARMARRALDLADGAERRVVAVSRWSDEDTATRLREAGVVTATASLGLSHDPAELPDAQNVVYMVGAKFGSAGRPAQTWATNTVLPALIGRRYTDARMAAFSTGNVYPLVAPGTGGCTETDEVGPIGEYAMSCLGRERAIENAAAEHGLRASIIRLNYAVEPRYGVLCDIAQTLLSGEPVDLGVGYVNVVWQRYANEVALRSLVHAHTTPFIVNVAGPETVPVQRAAEQLADLLGVTARFEGEPGETALLSNGARAHDLFGYPDESVDGLIRMQAEWLLHSGRTLGKPTKFQRRDGRF